MEIARVSQVGSAIEPICDRFVFARSKFETGLPVGTLAKRLEESMDAFDIAIFSGPGQGQGSQNYAPFA
jgi:hypothetical protein